MADSTTALFDAVEALCRHHNIDEFSTADEPEYAQWLDVLLDRSARGFGDRVLVAAKGAKVQGYVASIDTSLTEPAELEGWYFFVSAVAVSDEARGSSVFTALTTAILETVEPVEASKGFEYRGVLAQPGSNRPLQIALRALGFKPVPNTAYWAKVRAR